MATKSKNYIDCKSDLGTTKPGCDGGPIQSGPTNRQSEIRVRHTTKANAVVDGESDSSTVNAAAKHGGQVRVDAERTTAPESHSDAAETGRRFESERHAREFRDAGAHGLESGTIGRAKVRVHDTTE